MDPLAGKAEDRTGSKGWQEGESESYSGEESPDGKNW